MASAQEGHTRLGGSSRSVMALLLEAGALVSFVAIQIAGWSNIGQDGVMAGRPLLSYSMFLGIAIVGWLAADFTSGVAHYCADHFGDEATPLVGRTLILPFREHHHDPKAMLKHGFLERNGNSALISLPTIFWIPLVELTPVLRALGMGLLMMTTWVLWTNQIHAWAHQDTIPPWVRMLQKWGVLLSPEHHRVHHAPFDSPRGATGEEESISSGGHYCITSGMCDRLLTAFRRSTQTTSTVLPPLSCRVRDGDPRTP